MPLLFWHFDVVLKGRPTDKRSIRRRKMRALSDLPYREKLLFETATVGNS
jgi:hypothetical protein